MTTIRSLLFGVVPKADNDSVCIECKRRGYTCVLVAKGEPCLGPVTKTGCGALCPRVGRDCYGCYGPAENPNDDSLSHWFKQLGLTDEQLVKRYLQINNQAPVFKQAGLKFKGIVIVTEAKKDK